MARNLWEEVKLMHVEHLHREVEDWVVDLGNTTDRAAAYDHMLMLYWVNMNLFSQSSVTIDAECEGDEEPIKS